MSDKKFTANEGFAVGENQVINNIGEWIGSQANIKGPQGPQGAAGAVGPQGRQGLIGSTGASGRQGVTGVNGFQGQSGPQGVQGPQGAQGTAGATGLSGAIRCGAGALGGDDRPGAAGARLDRPAVAGGADGG